MKIYLTPKTIDLLCQSFNDPRKQCISQEARELVIKELLNQNDDESVEVSDCAFLLILRELDWAYSTFKPVNNRWVKEREIENGTISNL